MKHKTPLHWLHATKQKGIILRLRDMPFLKEKDGTT
jgi:hypothetical protein